MIAGAAFGWPGTVLSTFPSGLAEITLFTSGIVTIGIGIAIAYVAYRGFRRNASRAMLVIAIGFVLAIAIPGILNYGLYTLVMFFGFQLPIGELYLAGIMQTSEIIGMLCIFYALVME